jgi:hypothetical protein
MRHVATTHKGILLDEGKSTYVFRLPDGRQVKGSDLQMQSDWPWRHSPQAPGVRYVRLQATSPTYGTVTIIIVHEPGVEVYYLLCLETDISRPRLIRAWKRRHWFESPLRHAKRQGPVQVGDDRDGGARARTSRERPSLHATRRWWALAPHWVSHQPPRNAGWPTRT